MNPVVFARRESEGGAVCVSIDENCRFFAQLIEKVQPKLSLQATPQYLISMHFNDTDYAPTDEVSKFLTSRKKETDQLIVKAVEPAAVPATSSAAVSVRIDSSPRFCKNLLIPFPPESIPNKTTAAHLKLLVDTELLMKLPTSQPDHVTPEISEFVTCTEESRGILADTIGNVISRLYERNLQQTGTAEDMLHYTLDLLMRQLLTLFDLYEVFNEIEISRNQGENQTTCLGTDRHLRPDFLLWHKGVLVLKGEEKPTAEQYNDAVTELQEKFDTLDPIFFGDIGFLLSYAAAGKYIGFYAIDGTTKHAVAISKKMDLMTPLGRFHAIRCFINIIRIIRTISGHFPKHAVQLGKVMNYKNGTTKIMILPKYVRKTVAYKELPYASTQRLSFLRKMYQCACGRPGLVQAFKQPIIVRNANNQPIKYQVDLATRGLPNVQIPDDMDIILELKTMAECILTGLAHLHDGNFVHCDIRSPNILYVPGIVSSRYVLIDFEHAQKAGYIFPESERLDGWDEHTLEQNGAYTAKSDLYLFGRLLNVHMGEGIDPGLSALIAGLREKKWTAAEALTALKSL